MAEGFSAFETATQQLQNSRSGPAQSAIVTFEGQTLAQRQAAAAVLLTGYVSHLPPAQRETVLYNDNGLPGISWLDHKPGKRVAISHGEERSAVTLPLSRTANQRLRESIRGLQEQFFADELPPAEKTVARIASPMRLPGRTESLFSVTKVKEGDYCACSFTGASSAAQGERLISSLLLAHGFDPAEHMDREVMPDASGNSYPTVLIRKKTWCALQEAEKPRTPERSRR